MITDSEPGPRPRANPSASACEPYRERIEQAVSWGRNAMVIWQDLVDDHGFSSSYQSVGRFAKKLRAESSAIAEAHPVIETAAGQEGRSTTAAMGRWCWIRAHRSTDGCGCSCSRWAAVARVFGC